jgi:hypothetical protein
MKKTGLLVLVAVLLAAGLAAEDEEQVAWADRKVQELTPIQIEQVQLAGKAQEALAKKLFGELSDAMDKGSLAEAISVCRDMAPVVAQEIGEENGVTMGRTALRLRNPDNNPPHWAVPAMDPRFTWPQMLSAPDGRMGVLYPIRMGSVCSGCHGPADELDPEVKATLAEHYPEDQATGFEEGDVRGWYWIEVPPADGN